MQKKDNIYEICYKDKLFKAHDKYKNCDNLQHSKTWFNLNNLRANNLRMQKLIYQVKEYSKPNKYLNVP